MNEAIYPILREEWSLPLCVFSVGGCDYQYHVLRPDGYGLPQINVCTSGEGILKIEGKEYKFSGVSGQKIRNNDNQNSQIKIDYTAKFFLDAEGKIAFCDKISSAAEDYSMVTDLYDATLSNGKTGVVVNNA